MTAAPGGEASAFRRRPRRAVERTVLQVVLPSLGVLAGAVILGSGPVDYAFYGRLAGFLATLAAVVAVLLVGARLRLGSRVPVTLTPDGIDSGLPMPGLVPWPDVASLRTESHQAERHVLLRRRNGTAVRLYAPRGSGWLRDPAFDREIAEFRRCAADYGVTFDPDRQVRRWPAAVVTLAVLGVLAIAGVRAADRGVIWPSTPTATASQVTAACEALQAAGLDRVWPADTRTLDRDDLDRHELGEYSYCGWRSRLGRTQDAPYLRIAAVVRRHAAVTVPHAPFATSSPIAMAIRSYTSERDAESRTKPVPALGDEAFVSTADDEVLVAARRANVTVSITVYIDVARNPRDPHEVGTAARDLTAAIVASVRLDDRHEAMSQTVVVAESVDTTGFTAVASGPSGGRSSVTRIRATVLCLIDEAGAVSPPVSARPAPAGSTSQEWSCRSQAAPHVANIPLHSTTRLISVSESHPLAGMTMTSMCGYRPVRFSPAVRWPSNDI